MPAADVQKTLQSLQGTNGCAFEDSFFLHGAESAMTCLRFRGKNFNPEQTAFLEQEGLVFGREEGRSARRDAPERQQAAEVFDIRPQFD